jgi:aspartate racemase
MNQEKIRELQSKGQREEIAALLTQAAIRLRAGGAQAILFCANTSHKVYAQVSRKSDLPILYIGGANGVAIRSSGLKKVGLIGTLYTTEDGFMADWLKEHYGIDLFGGQAVNVLWYCAAFSGINAPTILSRPGRTMRTP